MTQQVVPDAQTDTSGPANTGDARLDSRANALFAKMSGARVQEAKAAPPEPGDPDFASNAAPSLAAPRKLGGEPAAADPGTPEDGAKKLDRIALIERDNVRAKQELAKNKREFAAEHARVAAKAKEVEHLASIWDNPDRLLEELARRIPPEKLLKMFETEADP